MAISIFERLFYDEAVDVRDRLAHPGSEPVLGTRWVLGRVLFSWRFLFFRSLVAGGKARGGAEAEAERLLSLGLANTRG